MKKLLTITFLVLCIIGSAAAEEVLRIISDIRSLPPETAAQGLPVELETQIVLINMEYGLFLYDGQHGIYADSRSAPHTALEQGDFVRLKGTTTAGQFMPGIQIASIEVLENRPLPAARPFRSSELYSTDIDCDWVSVSGRLLSIKQVNVVKPAIILELEQDNLRYDVQLHYSQDTLDRLSGKMLQPLTFNAAVGTLCNDQRQVCGRVFFVNTADDFRTTADTAPQADSEPVPFHKLMRMDFDRTRPVVVQGIVTSVADRQITLRGEKNSLKAMLPTPPDISVGDSVQLEGYIQPQPIAPAFRARRLKLLQKNSEVPRPAAIRYKPRHPWDPKQELNSDSEAELVELTARIENIETAFVPDSDNRTQTTLFCRFNSQLLKADLPAGVPLPAKVSPGAAVRLTGIAHLQQHPDEHWRVLAYRFNLQLRGTDDIRLIRPAPWWTPKRLMGLTALVFGISIVCLFWIQLLRRTVSRQTGVIARQIEQTAILEERQRIARELHDTLNQGLVGAALQVRSGCRLLDLKPDSTDASIKQTLELAQQMLEHCSEEVRTSILDLRGGILEQMDLAEAIQTELNALNSESGAKISFTCEGTAVPLKREAERNILRIAKEAASNAVRHASPTEVTVTLRYKTNQLLLSIHDNGGGFKADAASNQNRFGIQGMTERANRIGGKLSVNSERNKGTTVKLTLPKLTPWIIT